MDTASVEDLVRELALLASKEGVNSKKVRHATTVLRLNLRAKKPRSARTAEYDGFLIAVEAVAKQLDREAVGVSVRHSVGRLPAGSVVLGLLRVGRYRKLSEKLMERRDQISLDIWNGSGPEASTIARRENELFYLFATALAQAALDPTTLDAQLEPHVISQTEMPPPLTRIWQHSRFILDERDVIVEHRLRMGLRANVDSVSSYQVTHQYLNDPRPGVIKAVHPVRAKIIDERDQSSGANVTFLEFLAPLRLGEVRAIELSVLVASDIPCATRCRSEFVESINDEPSSVEVQFHLSRLPQEVWWYRTSLRHNEYIRPEGTDLSLASDGVVSKNFKWVLPGERYGIAWNW